MQFDSAGGELPEDIPTYVLPTSKRTSNTVDRPLTQIPTGQAGRSTSVDSQMERDAAIAFEMQAHEREEAATRMGMLQRIGSKYWEFQNVDHLPVFTWLMVFLNCLGFIITMYKADFKFASFAENPMFGPSATALIESGGQTSTLASCEGEWWRIFVSMFLHAGLIHLGFNMLSLWQLGSQMEKVHGTWQVVLIYTLSGIAGQLASAVFLPDSVVIGASGAIFGLFGAQWADFLQNYAFVSDLDGRCSEFFQLSVSTVVAIGFTLIPFVNAFAHLAGFITGSLIGYIVLIRRRVFTDEHMRQRFKKLTSCQQALMFVALFLILSEILVLAVLFGEDDVYSSCGWCEYLQCFDTPLWDCSMTRAASCSYTDFGNDSSQCVDNNVDFNTADACVVITCLDNSEYAYNKIPTPFDCFAFCGSDYSNCS